MAISCDVRSAALQLAAAWRRAAVAEFDAARAAAPPPPGAAPYWNVVFVDVISRVAVRLADADKGRMWTSATARQGAFAFARGPLPRRVVPEVHAPWWMIGWL